MFWYKFPVISDPGWGMESPLDRFVIPIYNLYIASGFYLHWWEFQYQKRLEGWFSVSILRVMKSVLRLVGGIRPLFRYHLAMTVCIWLMCGGYCWGRIGGDRILWWVIWLLDIIYMWVSFLWGDISKYEISSIWGYAMIHHFVCRRIVWRFPRWVLLFSGI